MSNGSIGLVQSWCLGDKCDPCRAVTILFCMNAYTEAHTDFCLGPAPPDGIRPVPPSISEEYFGNFLGVIVNMGHNYTGGQSDGSYPPNLEYLYSNVQSLTYTYGGLASDHPELVDTPCGMDTTHDIEFRPDPTYPGPGYPPCITWLEGTASNPTLWHTLEVAEQQIMVKPGYTLSQHDPTLTKVS